MAGASLAAGRTPELEQVHPFSSSEVDVSRSRFEGSDSSRHRPQYGQVIISLRYARTSLAFRELRTKSGSIQPCPATPCSRRPGKISYRGVSLGIGLKR